MKSYTKSVQKEEVPGRSSFDALVRNLIDDKYNREYKLDKKTRAKALEILDDYYAKHEDEATNVSELCRFEFTLCVAVVYSTREKNKLSSQRRFSIRCFSIISDTNFYLCGTFPIIVIIIFRALITSSLRNFAMFYV